MSVFVCKRLFSPSCLIASQLYESLAVSYDENFRRLTDLSDISVLRAKS